MPIATCYFIHFFQLSVLPTGICAPWHQRHSFFIPVFEFLAQSLARSGQPVDSKLWWVLGTVPNHYKEFKPVSTNQSPLDSHGLPERCHGGELTKRCQWETAWRHLTIFPYLLWSTLLGQVVHEGGLMMHLKKATTASQSLSKFWKEKQISKTKVHNGNIWYQIRHSLQQHGRWRLANSSCTQKIDRQFWHVLPEKNYPPHPRPPPPSWTNHEEWQNYKQINQAENRSSGEWGFGW